MAGKLPGLAASPMITRIESKMNGKIISAIGIAMATIGTVVTLWTILHTNPKTVGTWGELENRNKEFPKEQCKARAGYFLIVIGGFLQIVGLFM